MKDYYVYIMSNRSSTLYIGVTNDLLRRVAEHKQKITDGFTKRYNIDRLVYFEAGGTAESAIMREKQIKSWGRERKIELIESMNPEWKDLSLELMELPEGIQNIEKPVIKRGRKVFSRHGDSSGTS
ncbi:MAG: GIY-YIG nuclease family protein [Dehalococcoidia bacterium]|nr:GIY-YIG nuclease family protein [Dehalococcoidia bacterium]